MATPTVEELIERVRILAPELRARAESCESLRRLPNETVAELRETGLLRTLVPASLGGYGLGLGAVVEISREMGEACGSTAWCLAICTLHNAMVSAFPAPARDAVFANRADPIVCGVFLPAGTATPEGDGYRLSGEWDFASACDHADYAVLAAIVRDDQGSPRLGNFLVSRAEFRIEDNWYVAGLCGTGSKRVVVQDALIPAGWASLTALGAGEPPPAGGVAEAAAEPVPLPATSVATLGLTGVALGVARGALAEFQQRLAGKLRHGSFKPSEQQIGAQLRFAEAAAEVDAAELLVARDCAEMAAWAERGLRATAEQRARYRRDAAWVFQTCARAVARLQPAAGAHSIFLGSPLQRALRDSQVMATHIVADLDAGGEAYARAVLGLPRNDPLV